jgi:putative PIN family toxin of toxin-antitoxin system
MRVVLDTNIFISAFLWGGKPRAVLDRAIEGKDYLFISRTILAELAEVLARPKFGLDGELVERFVREIEDIAEIMTIKERIHTLCRDVDDNAIVECAVAASAEVVVTGDEDLLSLEAYRTIRIVTASDYLDLKMGTTSL